MIYGYTFESTFTVNGHHFYKPVQTTKTNALLV